MSGSPAIIAALPREVGPLVRGWQHRQLPGKIHLYISDAAIVACAGMGANRATLAVQAALAARPATALWSVGLAGACDPSLHVGDIVRAGVVIDSLTGERYASGDSSDVLVTGNGLASVSEKHRLHTSYNASCVDMEAATVARLAQANDIDFRAIKSISDEASFELEDLARFATPDGQFREIAFAAHAALRPPLWSKLVALAGNGRRAVASLTEELKTQINWSQYTA